MSEIIIAVAAVLALLTAGEPLTQVAPSATVVSPKDAIPPSGL